MYSLFGDMGGRLYVSDGAPMFRQALVAAKSSPCLCFLGGADEWR